MATEQQLKAALVKAHNAGDTKAAELFARKIKEMRQNTQADQSGEPSLSMNEPIPQRPQQAEPSFTDKALGLAETVGAIGTGMTTGAAGGAIGVLEGVFEAVKQGKLGSSEAQQIIESQMMQRVQQGTYQPRTESGQDYVAAIGEIAGALPAASPLVPEAAIAAQSARATAGLGARMTQSALPQSKPQAMGGLSVGAAEVPKEVQQYMKFQELPVPVRPTMADLASSDDRFVWKQFENEIAKDAEVGQRIRDAAAEKNSAVQANFEEFIDMTGTSVPESQYMYATGNNVVEALNKGLIADKDKASKAWKAAEQRGELEGIVPQDRLDNISAFINQNRAKRTNAPVIQGFVDEAFVKEVGEGSLADGTFRLKPMTINQAETMRKEVNRLADQSNGQDRYFAGEIKKMIDDAQEGLGGDAFKIARKLSKKVYDKYENNFLIDQLLSSKKGYVDAKIPAEMVVQKSVLSGSVDDLKNFRSVLMRSGPDGVEAWKDVQAAVLRSIRDEAIKGKSVVDNAGLIKAQAGAINKAVDNLDKNGKLNVIFGKKGADQLRLLREVSGSIAEQMTGTFNSSNNMAWVSMMRKLPLVGGAVGGIADAASIIKDRALVKKVNEAVNVEKTLKKKGIDVSKYQAKPKDN